MPVYTLSNWKKTVVFQTMSHISGENFYSNVKKDIEKYKKDWYVYFYEWVKLVEKEDCIDPVLKKVKETKECEETKKQLEKDLEKFSKTLWFDFSKDLYAEISDLMWLKAQNQDDFLNVFNDKDINVDLSLHKIISTYETKYWTWVYTGDKEVLDLDEDILDEAKNLNERELWLLRYVYKWLMNFMIKDENLWKNLWNDGLDNILGIIIDDRNKNLAQSIENSDQNKIYVTYWLLHFKWVYELLKAKNVNRMITDVKFYRSID